MEEHEDLSALVANLRDSNSAALLAALAELKNRVQSADLHNAGNHVTSILSGAAREMKANVRRENSVRSASMRSASLRQNASFRSASMMRAPSLMRIASRARVSGLSTSGGITTNSFIDGVPHGMRPPSSLKIDDAKLPIPPHIQHAEHIGRGAGTRRGAGDHDKDKHHHLADINLASPEGSHEWDALQMAVNDACSLFSTPSAIVAWKKWALNMRNVSLVVSLFWFVVSEVFLPDHPLSQRGALREHAVAHFSRQYILTVLQYKGLKKDLYNELWQKVLSSSVVLLLKDCYPRSEHKFDKELSAFVLGFIKRLVVGTLPGDSHPSLHDLPGQARPAAISRQQQQQQLEAETDFPSPPPPPPISDNEEDQEKDGHDKQSPSSNVKGVGYSYTSSHVLGFSTTKPSPVMQMEMKSHGLSELRSGEAAMKGQRTDRVGGRSQPSYRRPLDTSQGDDVSLVSLARACTANASEAVRQYEARRKEMAHEVIEGRRELGLYKASLDAKVQEITANTIIGDNYIPGTGDAIAPITAKTLANNLSSYLENDVQRLTRRGGWEAANSQSMQTSAFPTPSHRSNSGGKQGKRGPPSSFTGGLDSSSPSSSASGLGATQHFHPHLPTYLASTEANHGALHGTTSSDLIMAASSSGVSSTRIMAPWSRMRRCEEALSGALSQAKKNSSDVAARVFGGKRDAVVEKRVARGTADIKVQREARMILSGLDLEQYR